MDLEDAAGIALGLAGTSERIRHSNRAWAVHDKVFAWQRPFSKADLRRFGDAAPPSGEILAVAVADLGDKEAVLAAGQRGFFTIPHFEGYPAVLIELERASAHDVEEALVQAWAACAPGRLVEAYLDAHGRAPRRS